MKRSEDAFGKTGVRADGDRCFKRQTKPDQDDSFCFGFCVALALPEVQESKNQTRDTPQA